MPTDPTGYPPEFATLLGMYNEEIQALMKRLEQGAITVAEWIDEVRRILARFSQAAWLVGSGLSAIPAATRKMIGEWLAKQFKFLDGFGAVIGSSTEYNPAWEARARMYGASTVTQYWEGVTDGLPLPAMPGQGTQCLSNCRCGWQIEWINKKAGDADCYWVMSDAEHCQTCKQRARMWNPVRIRGGMLQ